MEITQAVEPILAAQKCLTAQCAKSLIQSLKIVTSNYCYKFTDLQDLQIQFLCEWCNHKPYSWPANFYIIPDIQYWWDNFLYKSSKTDSILIKENDYDIYVSSLFED